MALDEYQKKRDFTKSPEPRAIRSRRASPGRTTPRFFCVQKHLASHLHYDFRLEHDGVLLSWAVPKGPSLDPKTKRLAMHVEDHPIEYGTFEGVIPEGYGAGIVMLWDQGTWTPESDDVDKALAKGDLKFTLDGYKLKGSWVLVRTRRLRRQPRRRPRAGCSSSTATTGRATSTSPNSRRCRSRPSHDFPEILADDNPAVWRDASAGRGRGDRCYAARDYREGRGAESRTRRRPSARHTPPRRSARTATRTKRTTTSKPARKRR